MFWPGSWWALPHVGSETFFFFQGLPQFRRCFPKEEAHESWRISGIEVGLWKKMCQDIEAGIKKGEMCFPSIPVIMKLNIRLLRSVSSTYIYILYLKKNL